jgi:hypothetical protein
LSPQRAPGKLPRRILRRTRPAAITVNPDLAAVLEFLSLALLGIFLAAVLMSALSPKLLDPRWQLDLISNLINNGSLALVGALLIHLAIAFHPGSDRLRARYNTFRRWALAASIGFLLLIPLQMSASWKLYSSVVGQSQQLSQSSKLLSELRQAVTTATSNQEIEVKLQRLLRIKEPLSPTQLRTPINQLRQELLNGLNQESNDLQRRIEVHYSFNPNGLINETIRIVLSALFYAAGFASLSGLLSPLGRRALPGWLVGSGQRFKENELQEMEKYADIETRSIP